VGRFRHEIPTLFTFKALERMERFVIGHVLISFDISMIRLMHLPGGLDLRSSEKAHILEALQLDIGVASHMAQTDSK
jgi:hypothetical protein